MRMGLLYRGPAVGQDLGIHRGAAKPYRGSLYQIWQLTKFFQVCFLFHPTPWGCQPRG